MEAMDLANNASSPAIGVPVMIPVMPPHAMHPMMPRAMPLKLLFVKTIISSSDKHATACPVDKDRLDDLKFIADFCLPKRS
jgi:hypothetical protein